MKVIRLSLRTVLAWPKSPSIIHSEIDSSLSMRVKGSNPMIHGIGIHGQYLFVDRVREISISWFSSDNDPLSKERLPKVLSVVNRIRDNLT